jgi:hypothetical protein
MVIFIKIINLKSFTTKKIFNVKKIKLIMKKNVLNFKKILHNNKLIFILFLLLAFNNNTLFAKITVLNNTETRNVTVNLVSDTVIGWEFDSNDEGWNKAQHNLVTSWADGSLICTTTEEEDPYVQNIKPQSFSAKNVNFIQLRIKNNTSSKIAQFILFKKGGGTVAIHVPITSNAKDYQTVVFDLSKIATWDNSLEIDDVRIDANGNGTEGTIAYDFIRFTTTSTL